MLDTFVYFTTLTICITLGNHYRNIDNFNMKRNYGTGLGIITTLLVCGRQVYHTYMMLWFNIVILKYCDKRYVHQISLFVTWLHLLYIHIHSIDAQYVIWMNQNIALRLVGMAFEMHLADKPMTKPLSSVRLYIGDTENVALDPTVADIVSYALFFIGLHKGPYYRYKIFKDHFHEPYGGLGNCRIITENKLKTLLLSFGTYAFLRLNISPMIYCDSTFYKYDADTRYLYNIPLLMMYFLQCQMVMSLCSCVFTETGFGLYPARCMALPGHGPSNFGLANNLESQKALTDQTLNEEYNFAMIKCFERRKLLIGPRMKDTLRSWDMPNRYWFWIYIYKHLLSRASKEIRNACSFIAWTLWAGPSLQQLILSSTLWVYMQLEYEYGDLYNTKGSMKLPWDIGFSMMRMFCLIYLTPCLVVNDARVLLRYYNSICWVIHFILLVLIIGAFVTRKSRNRDVNI